MLLIGGPSEAKMFGRSGSSTESSQSGYDMTGEHALLPETLTAASCGVLHQKLCWKMLCLSTQAPSTVV